MSRKYYGQIVLLIVAIGLATALALALGGGALRVIVALPFALVLPGLALTAAAFPAGRLDPSERTLLSLGVSLAVIAVGGITLHLTPWGLHPASWAILLGLITVGAGGVALLRMRGREWPGRAVMPSGGMTGAQALLSVAAVVILAGALTLTVRGAQGQTTVGFTQLWMVPGEGAILTTVQLGLSNQEPATTDFRVQFEVDQRVRRTWSLTLEPGGTWTESVALPAELPATTTIEAILYREENPGIVYRRVEIQRGQR